ncbi:MAG: precorrin-3B C(17)-methyltransferase [Thermoanaerobacteraceae bacterium]
MGWVKVVGIGPGDLNEMTLKAYNCLRECEVIVGYTTYINLIKSIILDKKIITSGMRDEVKRCRQALNLASQGKKVCIISSGDAGIYGMAGLIYEIAHKENLNIQIEVIAGVTALSSAAAILGAPIMQDFAAISLSDHLIPWIQIEKRLTLSAKADLVIVIYNPKSSERPDNLSKAVNILLKYKSPNTPVGIVKNIKRPKEESIITALEDVINYEIDMRTTLIVGNKSTYVKYGKMVTLRGYAL